MGEFRVPFQAADSEFVEKRSRFISHLLPVESEEDARAFIAQIKKQYYDARHNCWCYLIGENVVRYSDDGEPQGTAGQPMLYVFQRENVTNVVCVVTRYFGGILLGAGGLTRAYSKGARDALCAAGYAVMGRWAVVDIPCSYALFERVRLEAAAQGGTVDDTQDGAVYIHLNVLLPGRREWRPYKNDSPSCPPEASSSRCCRRSSARGRGRSFEHLCRNAGGNFGILTECLQLIPCAPAANMIY